MQRKSPVLMTYAILMIVLFEIFTNIVLLESVHWLIFQKRKKTNFISSSSLGATTSVFDGFAILSIFPLIAILDADSHILYNQFLHVISYIIFPSLL